MQTIDLTAKTGKDEKILWQGKPQKNAFILRSFLNPMLPIAIVWAVFDNFFLRMAFEGFDSMPAEAGGVQTGLKAFLIPFILLHLMPVWLYLGGIVFSFLRFRNTNYLITDRAVYFSQGVFSINVVMKPLASLSNINVHTGIIDRAMKVGSVRFLMPVVPAANRTGTVTASSFGIMYIPDYNDVFKLLCEQQNEAYTDAQYPNDKR